MGILLGTLLIQIFYVAPYIRNQEIKKTEIYQNETANKIARELDISLNRIKNRLLRMRQFTEFRNMDIDAMQKIILQHEKISERISTVAVMNSEGWFVCGFMKDLSYFKNQNYADKPYFTIPFDEGKTYFTQPHYYPEENMIATSICVPIESESGERIGVLIGRMKLCFTINKVTGFHLQEGQIASIIDKEGTVVAQSNIDLFALKDGPLSLKSNCSLIQDILNRKKGGSIKHKHKGIDYFGSYAFLESNGWVIAVEASMKSILAQSSIVSKRILLTELLLFAIALIITIIFAKQITAAQRKAEKTLVDSEERFRTIVESTPGLLMITDTKGKFTYISPNCEKLTGYTREELLNTGKWWVHEDDQPKTMELFGRVINEGFSGKNYEFKAVKKNGELWDASSFWEPLKDNTGKVYSVVTQLFDISERKQADETLNQELCKRQILQDVALSLLETDFKKSIKTALKAIRIGLNLPQVILRIRDDHNNDWQIIDCRENLFGIESVLPTNKSGEETILAYEKKEISVVNDVRKKYWYEKHKDIWEEIKTLAYLSIPCIDYSGDVNGILYLHDNKVRIWSDDDKNIGKAVAAELASIIEIRHSEEEIEEKSTELEKQFEKSEKQRIANLVILNDLNKTTKDLRVEINEHKQAEEKLLKSEAQYKDLVEKGNVAIAVDDIDGKLLYFNKQFSDLFGYSMEDMKKQTHRTMIHPDDLKRVSHLHKSRIQGGKISSRYEVKGVKKDGTVIDIEISVSSVIEKDSRIIGTRSYVWNITERKRAEKIQKTLYNISNALNTVDNLHELFFKIRDYLGNVIDTTNFYVALYDEKTDMISLPFDVDEKDDYETFPAGKTLTSLVIKTGKPMLVDEKLLAKLVKEDKVETIGTRSEIWLGVPLKIENKVIGVIAVQSYDDPHLYSEKDINILTFISEEIALAIKHKQADENIRNAHKELKGLHKNLGKKVAKTVAVMREKDHILILQSRHAAMGEMIGNIAHQWRQPLAMVAAIIQNYEDAYDDGNLDMDYIDKHTELIMDILTNMSRTIDNFRFFFKPNRLKESFNIKDIIMKTIKFLESSFKFNQIKVSLDLEDNCIIEGFPNEYSQVLLVILANAKDELIERNIKKRKINILLKKIEDKCVLKISDNAGGIYKEVLPKIFDPYFTTKEEGKGTGIGLYMAKMIIEKNMDGKLTACNIKNGAEFRIEI